MNRDQFNEIWNLQGELNKLIGVDTIALGKARQSLSRTKWFRDYMDEASNEAFEAKENFLHKWWVKEVKENPSRRFEIYDRPALVLELIDVLHFLTSAAQTRDLFDLAFAAIESALTQYSLNHPVEDKEAYFTLNRLVQECMNGELEGAFTRLFLLFRYLEVPGDQILDVYRKKHAANVARQNNNYSVAGKTEDDNKAIERTIVRSDKYSGPKLKCRACGDVIQSKHVHDMVWCKCKSVAIDGGSEYTKISFVPDGPGYDIVEK